jgi:hypothetical protein
MTSLSRRPPLVGAAASDGDNEIYEITEDEANRIVDRIRRTVTGTS